MRKRVKQAWAGPCLLTSWARGVIRSCPEEQKLCPMALGQPAPSQPSSPGKGSTPRKPRPRDPGSRPLGSSTKHHRVDESVLCLGWKQQKTKPEKRGP